LSTACAIRSAETDVAGAAGAVSCCGFDCCFHDFCFMLFFIDNTKLYRWLLLSLTQLREKCIQFLDSVFERFPCYLLESSFLIAYIADRTEISAAMSKVYMKKTD
jgi:hypothetical protein